MYYLDGFLMFVFWKIYVFQKCRRTNLSGIQRLMLHRKEFIWEDKNWSILSMKMQTKILSYIQENTFKEGTA